MDTVKLATVYMKYIVTTCTSFNFIRTYILINKTKLFIFRITKNSFCSIISYIQAVSFTIYHN